MKKALIATLAVAFGATIVSACADTSELSSIPSLKSSEEGQIEYEYVASPIQANVDGRHIDINPLNFSGAARISNLHIVKVGSGCDGQLPSNVAGQVAVASRGDCSFDDKFNNARSADAAALIITDSSSSVEETRRWGIRPRVSLTEIPVFSAVDDDSVRTIRGGGRISITFDARVNERPAP